MEIKNKIDNSNLRKESQKKKIPILKLLFNKLASDNESRKTLLAVCPNSEIVLKAAICSAKRANAPILFAATLNQVDIDRGYTGWTHYDLVRKIKQESYHINYSGPNIVCIDHGGPWVKDRQTIEKWNYKRSMEWIKKSFESAIEAGYDMIHIDPTIDIFKKIEIDTVVKRTIELIAHCEHFIKEKDLNHISYEVGTEEVHGGLVDMNIFERFLNLLKKGLLDKGLDNIWPIFIVAKVGTDLHTSTFNRSTAEDVTRRVKKFGSFIKGHYTDFVDNPEDYPKSGMGGANVGPEFTMLEYNSLNELCKIEEKLYMENKIAIKSNLMKLLEKAVIASDRWKKWLREGEKDIKSISKERRDWIIKTSARYVWADPSVKCAQNILFENLKLNGINGEAVVLSDVERAMEKYFRAFNLINLNFIY